MNATEAAQLLAHAAAFDNRKPSAAASMAWAGALHDVPLDEDALAAVARFYGTADPNETGARWIQPHHVRAHRSALRADRLGVPGPGLSLAIPNAEPDDERAYRAALRDQAAASAAGQDVPALEAGEPTAGYDDNPHVRQILARFGAERDAARRRKVQQQADESAALKVYREAVEELLALPDHGEAATEQARAELLSESEAAAGFPALARLVGVHDEHKVIIWAARFAAGEEA